MTTEEMIKYDEIIELGIATPGEIDVARKLISGDWNEVLDNVCYIKTGYGTWEQYIESEMEEE